MRWIALFNSGYIVEAEDWPEIAGELAQLRKWAADTLDADGADYMTSRIDRLLREIPPLLATPGVEISIR